MLLKAGVDISRLKPQIRKKLPIIADLFERHTNGEFVVTSTYEGTHSEGSLHYADLAVDGRSSSTNGGAFSGETLRLVDELKEELGPDYDIINEGTHIHIEYDPK